MKVLDIGSESLNHESAVLLEINASQRPTPPSLRHGFHPDGSDNTHSHHATVRTGRGHYA
jgi:hypothetical protein